MKSQHILQILCQISFYIKKNNTINATKLCKEARIIWTTLSIINALMCLKREGNQQYHFQELHKREASFKQHVHCIKVALLPCASLYCAKWHWHTDIGQSPQTNNAAAFMPHIHWTHLTTVMQYAQIEGEVNNCLAVCVCVCVCEIHTCHNDNMAEFYANQ